MTKDYMPVNGGTVSVGTSVPPDSKWIPFLKQFHMCSAVWALYFANGLITGAPTVIVPQIRRDWNSTVTIDDELASWLYSASNFAALPWIFVAPAISHWIGRKKPYLICCSVVTIVFGLLYFSSTAYHILIALGIQGFVNASGLSILIHLVPEYCNHRYRSMFLNIQCTTFYWGIWTANAIGTFVSWKYIPILGFVCIAYSFTATFYPESPRWLASKGRVAECEAAHRWLFGSGADSEKELRDLLNSQMDSTHDQKMRSGLLKTLMCKQFYMPLLLVMLIGVQYNLSGKFVCSIYAIDILKRITKNEDAAYTGMLVLDGVTVFGMYVGSFLSKVLRMRPLFFTLSFISVFVMFTFSLYLYLVNLDVLQENNIVTLSFLMVYSLAISSGPIIICLSIHSVLISIKYQAVSYVIATFNFLVLCTGMLKFIPIIFNGLGIHGTFLFFAISSGIPMVLLYVYLPETKNKTLGEIEEYFKDDYLIRETEALTKQMTVEIKS